MTTSTPSPSNLPPEGMGDRISRLRLENEWSQDDLAKRIGTTGNQLSKYECGVREPSLEMLSRIARALQTTADFLISGRGPARSLGLESLPPGLRDPLIEFLGSVVKANVVVQLGHNAPARPQKKRRS